MAEVKVWFDKQADRLEIIYHAGEGTWKDTKKDAVQVKVDAEGNILGFSISGVSKLDHPLYLTLDDKDAKVSYLSFEEQRIFEESMERNKDLMKELAEM